MRTGYRIRYNTWRLILGSFFQIHNETVNIWTHFLGLLSLIYVITRISADKETDESEVIDHNVSKWPVYVMIGSAMVCMSCSTFCHLLWSKSPTWCIVSTAMDYQGILFLIFGNGVPIVTYRYACGDLIMYGYLLNGASLICCIALMIMVAKPAFIRPTPKAVTFIIYIVLVGMPSFLLLIIGDEKNSMNKRLIMPLFWIVLPYAVG